MPIRPTNGIQNDILGLMISYDLDSDEMVHTLEEMLANSYAITAREHHTDQGDQMDLVKEFVKKVLDRSQEILFSIRKEHSNDN